MKIAGTGLEGRWQNSGCLMMVILVVGLVAAALSGCGAPSADKGSGLEAATAAEESGTPAHLEKAVFAVSGMTCSGCEEAIKANVSSLDGVEQVSASHTEGKAEVSYDPGKVTPEKIREAIEKLQYKAHLESAKPVSDQS